MKKHYTIFLPEVRKPDPKFVQWFYNNVTNVIWSIGRDELLKFPIPEEFHDRIQLWIADLLAQLHEYGYRNVSLVYEDDKPTLYIGVLGYDED